MLVNRQPTSPILAFFNRLTRDQALVRDVVQQTFLQMVAARRNYKTGSDVLPWAFAIGRNVLTDVWRRTRKEVLVGMEDDDAEGPALPVERGSVPDDLAATHEIANLVRAALARLPSSQRAAYDLVRIEGLSVAETAAILGITPTAVKLRVHRVCEGLRGVVAAASESPEEPPLSTCRRIVET
jgi:RNA polymerase sigma-70 factor (ECF subfamily)